MTWKPTEAPGTPASLGEAVGQALGTASMCWVGGTGPAVFDSAAAVEVFDGLMAWLSDWADGIRAQANEATAAKIKTKIDEAFWPPQSDRIHLALESDEVKG